MTVVLYRSNLSLTSGAGQLIQTQAEGLTAAGETVRVLCRTGGLKFRLRTGLRVGRASARSFAALRRADANVIVDHGMEIPGADVVFVHNLFAEGLRHVDRDDWRERADRERCFFGDLRGAARIVANSRIVQRALVDRIGVRPERITVIHPGIDSRKFAPATCRALANKARRALGVTNGAPLVGFVTSGDFRKRGLDVFLDAASGIAAARPDVRFLVVGSRRLPDDARRHPLGADRRLLYRPKCTNPEIWFAALDLFLYPARFEEYGRVVAEAQAAGLPVLTSRRVGAAECLPREYDGWVLDEPDAAEFADRALALLDDADTRARLSAAGLENARKLDQADYIDASIRMIRAAR